MHLQIVVTGIFTTAWAYAGNCCSHARTSASKIPASLVELIKTLLNIFFFDPLKHDVTSLAMEGNNSATVLLPDIAEFPHHFGVIVKPGSRLNSHSVKFSCFRNLVFYHRIAGYDTCAITIDCNKTAFPVPHFGIIGVFKLVHHATQHGLFRSFRKLLEPRNKAWPGTFFQLIKHWCRIQKFLISACSAFLAMMYSF